MAVNSLKAQGWYDGKEEARVGGEGYLKEEGAWADVVSERTGVWIPPAAWRTCGILTTPPSTHLTSALVTKRDALILTACPHA